MLSMLNRGHRSHISYMKFLGLLGLGSAIKNIDLNYLARNITPTQVDSFESDIPFGGKFLSKEVKV